MHDPKSMFDLFPPELLERMHLCRNRGNKKHAKALLTALLRLPFFDYDLYLKMQADNIALVDYYLERLEIELLSELISLESGTPAQFMFVSAVSQMWVLAVFELLRTWRQRADEVLEFGKGLHKYKPGQRRNLVEQHIRQTKGSKGAALLMRQQAFRQVANKRYYERLYKSRARVKVLLGRIAPTRTALAKHEIPGKRHHTAYAPGYGRISSESGSIMWFVEDSDGSQTIFSRRGIADDLRCLWTKNTLPTA